MPAAKHVLAPLNWWVEELAHCALYSMSQVATSQDPWRSDLEMNFLTRRPKLHAQLPDFSTAII
jgi:hypothetical protein